MGRLFDLAPKVADTVKDYMEKKSGAKGEGDESETPASGD